MKSPLGSQKTAIRVVATILIFFVSFLAIQEIYQVANGTQNWVGKFTLTWGLALAGLILFGMMVLFVGMINLWGLQWGTVINRHIANLRDYLSRYRWIFAAIAAFIPAKIVLYTPLGFKFTGIGFRLALFGVTSILIGVVLTRKKGKLISFTGILAGIILSGSVFAFAKSFITVVDYPFSLNWSEGNRIWDYSILFGRDLYHYPADQPLKVYIDQGRQTLWGLPFLLPDVSILGVRLWSALVFTVPYTILGWMSFRYDDRYKNQWFWLGLWSFLFLNQGPIYTPLVLTAMLVVSTRRKPAWIALPVIFLAGLYAQTSRFTWMIAAGMWAVLITLADAGESNGNRISLKNWLKIFVFGVAGFGGGIAVGSSASIFKEYLGIFFGYTLSKTQGQTPVSGLLEGTDVVDILNSGSSSVITDQALLWDRLLPNPTFGLGILLGLLFAIGPLVVLLVYLNRSKRWKLNYWQQMGSAGILISLMAMGIIISTKIGGGGDLHNLDMFLIGLLLISAFAWESGGREILFRPEKQPYGIQLLLLAVVAVPAFMPWIDAYPMELPPEDKTQWTLDLLRSETQRIVAEGGEILFMDQRQLLTFGYLGDIPLVPEYEKKLVMDKAMSGNKKYFEPFYRDIANQRFALIITDPQRIRFADEDEGWGAENDTWVEWVTEPLLCSYEPVFTIKATGVWFLMPRQDPGDCLFP